MQTSLNALRQLVVIRHNDDALPPLMSPLLESTLKESIQLNILEARWAVLNNNPTIYAWHCSKQLEILTASFISN